MYCSSSYSHHNNTIPPAGTWQGAFEAAFKISRCSNKRQCGCEEVFLKHPSRREYIPYVVYVSKCTSCLSDVLILASCSNSAMRRVTSLIFSPFAHAKILFFRHSRLALDTDFAVEVCIHTCATEGRYYVTVRVCNCCRTSERHPQLKNKRPLSLSEVNVRGAVAFSCALTSVFS